MSSVSKEREGGCAVRDTLHTVPLETVVGWHRGHYCTHLMKGQIQGCAERAGICNSSNDPRAAARAGIAGIIRKTHLYCTSAAGCICRVHSMPCSHPTRYQCPRFQMLPRTRAPVIPPAVVASPSSLWPVLSRNSSQDPRWHGQFCQKVQLA